MNYLFLIFTVTAFSTMEVVSRSVHTQMGPFFMTFARFLLGTLFMLPFFIARKENINKLTHLPLREILLIAGIGTLSVFFSMGALQIAVHNGNASIPAILISSNPLFIYIINGIRNRKFERALVIKLAAGIAGITFIIVFSPSHNFKHPIVALTFSFAASVIFAIYTILARNYVNKYGNLFVTFISFCGGTLMYIPFIFILGEHTSLSLSISGIISLLYMGIVVTGAGYLSYFRGLKAIAVERGSMVFFLKPVFAVILSVMLLGESVNTYQIIAMMLVLYAVFPKLKRASNENDTQKA